MFWKKKETNTVEIGWENLTQTTQLEKIIEESKEQPVLIYKHSTRCGISSMALDRLERSWDEDGNAIKPYFLDLIANRNISNIVAEMFNVYHQSPQIIVIKNGKAVFDDSHMGVSFQAVKNAI
ncbi:MAG: bacillithiol system redox-active protein YtxJ [Roseivirga sp.]|nr:bacillithiol system redox-active protein YtxJ [Roseivirga sp.]